MLQEKKSSKIKLCGGGKLFYYSLLSLSIANAFAEEATLGTINVIDSPESIQNKKVGETVKTAKTLEKQQVSDTRDLVKYETGITVVEKGRMGASGYNVRGVDENRVDITIDGLEQAESLSSKGFEELFEGYGNFNNTRNGVEIENIKQVNLAKGANSTKVGSGALGGAVIFETKDARDFLINKNFYYKFKSGYASANNQAMFSNTVAGRYKDFDALLVRTDRDGTQLENFGYSKYDDYGQGRSRRKADPYDIEKHSTLIKLGYSPNETNRFTVMLDDGKKTSKGNDWSYTLGTSRIKGKVIEQEAVRHTKDTSSRRNIAFSYENYDSNFFWDSMKVSLSNQQITQRARTDEYCDGGKNCKNVDNPLGLQFKGGDIVDKEGNKLTLKEVPAWEWDSSWTNQVKNPNGKKTLALVDKNGNEFAYPEENMFGDKQDQSAVWDSSTDNKALWINCNTQNCNGSLTFYHLKSGFNGKSFIKDNHNSRVNVDLNQAETIQVDIEKDWNGNDKEVKTIFNVEDIQRGGKHWKHITATGGSGWDGPDYMLIKPSSPGYAKNYWKDRRLNTKTTQLNLDFEKAFDFKDMQHQLSYGGLLTKSEKSMVNYSGYSPADLHWWGSYFDSIDDNGNPACKSGYSTFCHYDEGATTFLLPVKITTGALYFANDIQVNDWLGLDMGYRYDRISYKPTYEEGKTPSITENLFLGAYYPIEIKKAPQKEDFRTGSGKWDFDYAAFRQAQDEYRKYREDLEPVIKKNKEDNKKYLTTQKQSFSHHSYSLGATVDPTDYLRVQAKYSTGFRAPTSEEVYFTFSHPDFSIRPNLRLKPEIAKTKELAFTLHKDRGYITLSGFRTDYKDFIDLQYQGTEDFPVGPNGGNLSYDVYKNINQQKAKVYGFEIDGKLFLEEFIPKLKGFNVGYKYSYQKGKIKGKEGYHPMNAIQPHKQVVSLGYIAPEQNYGVDVYWTHISSKKAKDTYNQYYKFDGSKDTFAKHRSDSFNVFDVMGFYKPIKNLTLQAGIYNLFNKEYLTWENARSIRPFGTVNRVCTKASGDHKSKAGCGYVGQGIERFHSPERNFKFNLQYEF
ncbi:TonB-dependent hemoglobin/transferrin/lactoferrin family receptor [Pasteurella skyensis]|uniref:TonB-dependent hemoglobin/transferrin/lactoferrin family receptor n=1 Tax=Phocoenobacter skyensis TaxID=97481 RepID=UPI00279401C3|nr:TonB-dependent hemoglobin/transferrin/lactoferrin family receptor [Pasteurella skyensis]MDP8170585.1 TonB-dependent hemoglobin/transferrin/lactoferrin family receptor [Pasteurella skyensis]